MDKTVIVHLTEEEARQFLMFQRHRQVFEELEPHLTIGFGKIVFNFAGGILQNVIKEEVVYKR